MAEFVADVVETAQPDFDRGNVVASDEVDDVVDEVCDDQAASFEREASPLLLVGVVDGRIHD